MIVINSRKMVIPEDERFVGFLGDNQYVTKEFVLEDVIDENNIYTLFLTFTDGKVVDVKLSGVVKSGMTTLTWNIQDNHIIKSGLIKAQIKVETSDDGVYYTTSDYFYACKTLPFEGDIGDSGYTDIYDLQAKIKELITSELDAVHDDLVPISRKIAGISLESDISSFALGEKLVLSNLTGVSPGIDTEGFKGQLYIEGDNVYVLTSVSVNPNVPDGVMYNWEKLISEARVKNNYLRKISLVSSVDGDSTDNQIPSAKLFYDTVGNIESALDSIISMQNNLIGGATV